MLVPGIALVAAAAMHAQITNPIPNPVIKRGLSVEIRDVVRLPETRRLRPADQDVTPAGAAPTGRPGARSGRGSSSPAPGGGGAVRQRPTRPPVPARRQQAADRL